MSARSSKVNIQTVEAGSSESMAEKYISVGEVIMMVTPFSGNKKEVLIFISIVGPVFEVINPNHKGTIYKSVLTRISGEPRTAI
jgi:hypothetical protein